MSSEQVTEERYYKFRRELERAATKHHWAAWIQGWSHHALILGAALAGFASLAIALLGGDAKVAGLVGAIPSVATILSQQFRCVKARSWNERMETEIKGIISQLNYELQASPTLDDLASLSKQWRTLQTKMRGEWESVTSSQQTLLGGVIKAPAAP